MNDLLIYFWLDLIKKQIKSKSHTTKLTQTKYYELTKFAKLF